MKYKVGDRVKSIRLSCQGEIGKIIEVYNGIFPYFVKFKNDEQWKAGKSLKLVNPTLEDMSENTVIEREGGSKRKVMFVLKPGLYVMKNITDANRDIYITNAESMDCVGYKIKEEIEELTVKQVCEELGREVVIKKG